jgi:predicted dehydrogenase
MLKVCIAGLGRAGILHARNFSKYIKGVELACLVDPAEKIAEQAEEEFGVKCYGTFEDAMNSKSIDAVVIATPSFLHAEQAKHAIKKGKNVFCEKPLALRLEDATEICQLVKKHKVKFLVGYMRRFDKYYKNAKEKITSGKIGDPLIFKSTARDPTLPAGWTSNPELSGGIFPDMLSHDFDCARWLMGREVMEVSSSGGAWIFDQAKKTNDLDTVGVLLKFEKGVGIIDGCRKCTYGYDLRTEIVGTEGAIMVGSPVDQNFSLGKDGGITPMQAGWFWDRFKEAFLEEEKHFVDCVEKDLEPVVNAKDGKKALEISLASRQSYSTGKPVALDKIV